MVSTAAMRFVRFLLIKRGIESSHRKTLTTSVSSYQRSLQDTNLKATSVSLHKYPSINVERHDLLDNLNKSLELETNVLSKQRDDEYIDCLGAPLPVTFNLAAYANRSKTLQKLIDLGVQLHEVEQSKDACELIMRLDFERDIKKYLIFLHDIGIEAKDLGNFITKYPMIFDEEMENLETRIKYLKIKKWRHRSIINILNTHPAFLSRSIYEVDAALGFVKNHYDFTALEVRKITEKWPFIVDVSTQWHRVCKFSFKEEMGFTDEEMRTIFVTLPCLFAEKRNQLVERFDLIHNELGISHELLTRFPEALRCELRIMKERHLYLAKLNRVQYDPTKPCYVPLFALTDSIGDSQFADKYAKTSVIDYNLFLKSL